MTRVRNIAIYYIFFGIICTLSFVFFDFYWISIIGVLLLMYYYVAKYVFKVNVQTGLSKGAVNIISIFFIVLPPLTLLGIELYYHRSFKQKILIPKNYEGVVVVGFGLEKSGKAEWDNGYRLIKVNNEGLAATRFTIPQFIGGTLDATIIYYSNDLNSSMPVLSSDPLNNDTTKANAYIVDFTDEYQVYVVTKNYRKYFVANTYNKPDSIAERKIALALNKLSSVKQ